MQVFDTKDNDGRDVLELAMILRERRVSNGFYMIVTTHMLRSRLHSL